MQAITGTILRGKIPGGTLVRRRMENKVEEEIADIGRNIDIQAEELYFSLEEVEGAIYKLKKERRRVRMGSWPKCSRRAATIFPHYPVQSLLETRILSKSLEGGIGQILKKAREHEKIIIRLPHIDR